MNNRKSIFVKTVASVLMGLAFTALTLVLQLPMTAHAKGNQAVTYLDENGKEHTITSYNTLNVTDTSFGGGVWVTAMGAEGTAGTFKLTGDTVLIVTHLFSCDGIDTRGYNLTIYGDSNSASSPHVLSTKDFGICGKGTLTICSGCLDSHSRTPSFPALGCEGGTFIKGGRVKAVADAGSSNVPAIGGGKVVISGGDVNALNIDQNSSAAAIGGEQREDGDVTITGGNVTASTTYGVNGAAIGGSEGRRGVVKISGGTVKATTKAASSMGAAIGGGKGSGNDEITITGGNVYANTSGETPRFLVMSPAIGSGYDGRLGSVTITGGTVNAVSRGCNAIGSGFMNTTKQDIKITGGNVTARDANGSCSGIGTAFSSGKKLILGWTSTSDRINGGFVSSDYKSWNVAFSTGTYFWLGDTNYAATTSNLDGRTLIPSERSNICTASFYKYKSGKTSLHKEVSVGIGGKVSDPGDPYAGVGGYNFTAWKQGGYSGSTYDFGSSLTGNLELYADYTSSVTYRYGNDDPDKTVQVPRGSKLTKPADPASISGLILFKGWRKQGEDHEYDFNSVVYDPFTLEAIWEYEGVRYVGGKGVTNDYRTIDRITDNTLNSGDWVVERDITFDERVEVSGTVNLILTDGCTMTASKGITVQSGNTLNIFGQEGGTGNLVAAAESNTYCAGIGGASGNSGTIVIYSGNVKATGGNGPTGQTGGAGIGGAYDGFGYVTIHGGNVEGHGGRHSPGIGGSGADITITGGKVYGQGGYLGGGIGGASSCENIVIRISGGSVNGSAMMGCCGIGFGRWGEAKVIFCHGDGEIEVGDTSFGEVVFEEAFKLKDTETLADGKNLKGRTLVPCNAVYFNANGGSGKMSAVAGEYGDSYTIPACGFDAPAGKVFMCWQDSDGTEYQPGQEIMILKDLNLSAQWMALQDLSFESVTDENPSGAVVKTYGDGPFTNAVSGAKTTVSWQSSDNTVAQVGQDGQVTILKAGQVFITAVAEGTSEYAEGRASYLLTVEPEIIDDPALSIDQSYVYTGSIIIPDVTVKAGDTVIDPEEYEVIASDNVKAGTAGATISGTDSGNYIFTNVSPVGFTIARKPVSVTGIKAKNKHYDENTDVELDFSGVMIEGKVSGDNLEASAEGAFTDAEPGENKTVNIDIDTLTLTGKDKANYVLSDSGHQTATTATIYAPHTVKFVNEEGTQTDIPDETVKNGEKATDPIAPLDKDGYLQVGWNLDGEQFDFDKPLDYETTVTLTLKPRFLKLHKVYEGAYVEAGGSGTIQWENSRHDKPTGSPGFVTEVAGETVTITAAPDTGSVTAWFTAYYMEGGARIEIPCCMVGENEATFTVPEMPDEAEIYVTASFAPNDDMLKALTDPSDATGNTISVNSASQLILLSNYMATPDDPEKPSVLHNMKDKTIKLTADIDVTGSIFDGFPQEISGTSHPYIFEGIFDGNWHTISGLNVDRGNDSSAGLFRAVGAAGRVQNLTVKGTVKGGGSDGTNAPHNVGGIAASNSGTIENCTCLVNVTGDSYSRNGGIAGLNTGYISMCYYLGMGGEYGSLAMEPSGEDANGGTSNDCTALYSVTGSDNEYDGVVTIESAKASEIEVDGYFEGGSDVTLTLSATDREGWTLDGFKYEKYGSGEDVNLTESGSSYVLYDISQNVNILPDYIYNALKDLGQDDQNYYLIKTVADLEAVAQAVVDLQGCSGMGFRLANDIDFEGENFSGLAVGTDSDHGFSAVFDGDGHVIRNMVIESDANEVGFVGHALTGEVKDLILEDCHVLCTNDSMYACAGMVAGNGWNSTISGCRVIGGSVIARNAGAIIGDLGFSGHDNLYSRGVTVFTNGATQAQPPGTCGSPQGDVNYWGSINMAVVAWTVRFLDGFNEAAMAAPELVPDNETALRPEEDRIYPLKHEHYLFNGKWQREDGSEYTFGESGEEDKITEDTVLYSIWDEAPVHTVTMTDSESDKTAQVRVYEDESGEGWPLPECFIAPAPGREFDKWKYGNNYYEMGDRITFTEDISIEAYWKDAEYRIVREDMEHGTVTAAETARYNETIRPGVTPDKGFSLDTLSCNTLYGKGVEIIDGSFTMPADDVSLSATFKLNDYTVTSGGSVLDHGVLWVNQSEAGDLSVPVTVHYGDEAAVLPDEGYALLSCTVTDADSKPVPVSGGVFTVPDSDLTVTAVFIPEEEQEDCKHLHTEIRNVKTATCTEEGYSGDTYCKDCGIRLIEGKVTPIDPDNHDFDEGVVTKEPTHLCDGVKTATCRRCGKVSDSVPVPRLTDDEESNTLIEDLEQTEGKVTVSENVIRKEDGWTETVVLIDGKEVSKTVTDADGNVTEVKTVVWVGGLKKSYRYTGAAIKPACHVYDGVKLLKEKTDYTVNYRNNKKVGPDASVIIKFKGNYKGSEPCTVKFTIEPAVIGEDVLLCDTAVTKTGKTINPTLDVLWAGTGKKVSTKEFVFACTENREIKEPGVYTVSAAPKNGNPNFTIAEGVNNEASLIVTEKTNLLSKAKVTLDPSRYYYNGDAIIPEKGSYALTLNGKPLAEDTDYVVDCVLNNVNPGSAVIVFVAKDSDAAGISGTKTAAFKILKGTDITNDEKLSVGIKESSVPYAKGGAIPQVTVSYNGHRLTSGTDYTVKYGKNKAVTNGKTAEVTVSGKGNFKGKKIVNFEITSQTITALSANILIDDKVTSPKGYEDPKVTVTDLDGKILKNGTDYELTNYREPDDNNTVTVDVVGKGNYKGTVNTSYRIIAKDRQLGKAGAEKIAPKAYTGEKIILAKEDLARLLFAGKGSDKKYLVPGTDFEVASYSNNLNAGTAKVTVRGLGNYGGLRTLTFKITGKKADLSGNDPLH